MQRGKRATLTSHARAGKLRGFDEIRGSEFCNFRDEFLEAIFGFAKEIIIYLTKFWSVEILEELR